MSDLSPVSKTLTLLEDFRATVHDFASREERLNREHRNLAEAAQARFHKQKQAAEAELAEKLARARTQGQTGLDHIQTRYANRERRLHDAHGQARKHALERVELEEGRRKYAVQKNTLEIQRRREEQLAGNDAALEQFRARQEEARADSQQLQAASRSAFRGMPFQRFLRREAAEAGSAGDHLALQMEAEHLLRDAREELVKFRSLVVPKFFRSAPLWVWLVIAAGLALGLSPLLQHFAYAFTPQQGYAYAGALFAAILLLYFAAYQSGATLASEIASALLRANGLQQLAEEKASAFHKAEIARIEHEANEQLHHLQLEWDQAVQEAIQAREAWPKHLHQKWQRARATNEDTRAIRTERAKAALSATLEKIETDSRTGRADLEAAHKARIAELERDYAAAWKTLEEDWLNRVNPLLNAFRQAKEAAQEFPEWTAPGWSDWKPPKDFRNFAPFAQLDVDLAKYAGTVPQDARLALKDTAISLPLLLNFPREGSLLFETSGAGKEAVMGTLNELIFRLLSTTPAGRLSFTIFDPVSLGQNFAPVTHLADLEENLIDGRIWTQPDQIDQRLADLNEHMEKVIQMYLRNEYESIAEYNRAAGNIAEKYHFLVIADFPANFTEAALKRLLRIATSGARCGVYTWIHWDHRHPAPPDHLATELRNSSLVVKYAGNHFVLPNPAANPGKVVLHSPPPPEVGNAFLTRVGETSRGASRVEVPFAQVAPGLDKVWTMDTSQELRVAIGRSGANKLQYLALGKGTRQHALIAGKTGSGKSTLFHVMITNLALWCSPEQVEFYLVDFKKGVEFKSYATHHLPHARVIAIESDRDFGLSVLQRVDDELRRRGEMFRHYGVQDIAGFKAASGQPLPRTLLMIDEFQEFFVEEDRVAQSAAMLLDRIVRQGRAFGIHVLLGSQTLGGAYTLARATLGQMAIRIALQCNETDAYLIMDESNPAPRLLSRPGEGIYNDMSGAVEGNSPFQVVWLSERERAAALQTVEQRAAEGNFERPVVFEGNAPADVRENAELTKLLAAPQTTATASPRIWLGAPNSIKGPTEVIFQRQSASNLLIVGQREEAVLSLLGTALFTLAAQFAPGQARFVLFESTSPGTPERAFLDQIVSALPHKVLRGNPEAALAEITSELDREESVLPTFVLVHNLQNFKRLRPEDEFSISTDPESPSARFSRIVNEGAAKGIHLIISIDLYSNLTRCLGRKGLGEFALRVAFQMSPSDSASLIDDPKASTLGMYRALLYNEQEGRIETFRPYSRPSSDWFTAHAKKNV